MADENGTMNEEEDMLELEMPEMDLSDLMEESEFKTESEEAGESLKMVQVGLSPGILSPTLQNIPPELRPAEDSVCQHCPHSLWYLRGIGTEAELQGICKDGLFRECVIYSIEDPRPMALCDGLYLQNEE